MDIEKARLGIELTTKGLHVLMEAGVGRDVWERIAYGLEIAEEQIEEEENDQ